ncbi:VWA domain-containing protein [Helicobacter labacensis]|uniref:VWA domain-containing protein n=1 Tax=Helicobacter labacensis TaxID=2316079 RepID=UPI001F356A7E|nr:VWA domain-containing protein [Helicobacter labacensis]
MLETLNTFGLLDDPQVSKQFGLACQEKDAQIKQTLKDHPFFEESLAHYQRKHASPKEKDLVKATRAQFHAHNQEADLSFIDTQEKALEKSKDKESDRATLHRFILEKWQGVLDSKISAWKQATQAKMQQDFLARMRAWFKALWEAKQLAKQSPELFGTNGLFMDAKGLALESLDLEDLGDKEAQKRALENLEGLDTGLELEQGDKRGGKREQQGNRGFSLQGANPKRLNLAQILALFNQIKNNKALMQICDLLGRMKEMQQEMIKEMIKEQRTYAYTERHPTRDYKEEICGVHLSNDLENLLPQELAMLNDPDLETLFYLKFVEKRLFCFEKQGYIDQHLEGIEKVEVEIEKEQEKEGEKGPIIICVDTSASMSGAPELIAKALTLSLTSHAKKSKRSCFLINFSSQTTAMDLSKGGGLARLNEFLSLSFGGGTDVGLALTEGLKAMQEQNYKKADLLVISDGDFGTLNSHLEQQMRQKRQDKNRFYLLDVNGNSGAKHAFDKHWVYDSQKQNIRVLCELSNDLGV